VLGFGQFVPPGLEFVRDLDVPRHNRSIIQSYYKSNIIILGNGHEVLPIFS
jgi:hypothetical protein